MECKNDLRYIKTKEAISNSFRVLLSEMPYEKITVKLLAERARINRKTFYLHYDTLDELLQELSHEIVLNGISQIQSYKIPQDLKNIIFVIFQYWQSLTEEDARIFRLCSASAGNITFVQQMRETFTNFDPEFYNGDTNRQKIALTFICNVMGTLYREWTIYHAVSTIKEAVELTYTFIMNGINVENDTFE